MRIGVSGRYHSAFSETEVGLHSSSLYCLAWRPLLADGGQWLTTFSSTIIPTTVCAKRKDHGQDTVDEIWQIIVNDLACAFYSDFGDHEHHPSHLHVNHWSSHTPRYACNCRKDGALNFRNLSPGAPHRIMTVGHHVRQEQANLHKRCRLGVCFEMWIDFQHKNY